ncbi:major facilitator superfamily domain-containing protein [Aspergillus nidulans var. acristatus]
MVFYLYKHIKKSRAAKRQSHSIPLRPFDGQNDGDSITPANTSALHEKSISHEAEAEKRRRRVYRLKLVCALFMPYFLATIDLTIVATSVPFIASHFNELSELNWIVTAFTLTSTALIPSFGQLSDVFGRHVTLQLATFLMLVGSVLGAAAQTWGMLLLGRALQGVGSAGLMSTVMIILADNVTLEENAKNNSIFSFIAFLSHIIVYVVLRNDLKQGTHFRRGSRLSSFLPALATIDIVGTILFIFGVGLIILGTAWGGSTYPWVSAEVLAPLIVGGACFALFFVYEYFLEKGVFGRIFPAQKPMLPYSMFKKIDTLWLAILQFAAGAAMYSVFYYVGVYFTVVEAYSASRAGVQLLYYIPGLGAGVYLAILLCNTYPAQTFPPLLFGTVAETIGLGIMIYAIRTEQSNILNGTMVLAGAGTGIRLMPASLHASGVWPDRLASALSLLRFALPFGGTLGITIMGSVFNNKLAEGVASIQGYESGNVSAQDLAHGGTSSLSFINSLPADAQAKVRTSGRDAIMWAYVAILPIIGVSVLTTLFMGNVWIGKRKNRAAAVDQGMSETEIGSRESEVISVPYLYALVKGINKYKYITRPALDSNPTEASGRQETQ